MEISRVLYNMALGLPGLMIGVVLHEFGHALMAHYYGDDTARHSGRLTLNPASHMDPIGTILLPVVGALIGGIMFGWAKPVPINPRNFSNYRKGMFWVSFAGPLTNILLAVVFGLFYAILVTQSAFHGFLTVPLAQIFREGVYINVILATFNLIPFPPLDGSKMLGSFLPHEMNRKYEDFEQYAFFFFLFLIFSNVLRFIFTPAFIFTNKLLQMLVHLLAF